MKRMLQTASRGAMIALIAATPVVAYAQAEQTNTEDPTVAQEQTVAPDTADGMGSDVSNDEVATPAEPADDGATDMAQDGAAGEPMLGEESTSSDMASDDGAAMGTGDQMAAEAPAKPVDGQITMQDADTVLAEDLLGATVYNNSDENVGDINDLIIGLNGDVKGVVIGVGGFLGIGEKDVAVEMAALDVIDQDGSPRLVTTASKTDLEAAPSFVSAAQQSAAAQQDMQSTNDTMTDGMGGTTQPTE